MNKLVIAAALVLTTSTSAHAAFFGLIPTQRSVEKRALRAGWAPSKASEIAREAIRSAKFGGLNRGGIETLVRTGDLQKGLETTRALKKWR